MAVDPAIYTGTAFSLGYPMFFPASVMPDTQIVVGGGQHMRRPFASEYEGKAVRLQDFFSGVIAEIRPPLICFSRVQLDSR